MFRAFMFLNVIPLHIRLHTALNIKAVIYEIIVYTTVNISNLISPTANVTIKNIAKKVAATSHGHLSIFCRTIDNIITASGIAKIIVINPYYITFLSKFMFIYNMGSYYYSLQI